MLQNKDLLLISHLRQNSRVSLTTLSKKTNIPVSTIYDRLRLFEEEIIAKHTTLIDFPQLGYGSRASLLFKVDRDKRAEVRSYLLKHTHVNTVYKVNNGYDFYAEVVFKTLCELEAFIDSLRDKFPIQAFHQYYIVEDLKKEWFLSDPEMVPVVR